MARLLTDDIMMEITNIISFRSEYGNDVYESFTLPDGTSKAVRTVYGNDIYESFTFKFDYHGQKLFNNVSKTKFELLDGNIQGLLDLIYDVLNKNIPYGKYEFQEPQFEFEITRIDGDNSTSMYEFTAWMLSGMWFPLYSSTGVGCRFLIYHNELLRFYEMLKDEYENRRIIPYNNINEIDK